MWPFAGEWYAISQAKQKERETRIAEVSEQLKSLDTSAQKYTKATATEIVAHIGNGEWTAVEVLKAYISRAIEAQKHTNAITEVLFTQALEEAKQLDIEFSQTKKLRGPLHGVPISFKDQFEITGYDASIGFSAWCNKPSTRDAELVRIVREAGGIPFAKTNVPQTMLAFECSNPVFGRSSNPWSSNYVPGGSSGGEAALLACDGSALGFGSDIGGSLRIPALFSGIYSLKPAGGRISAIGMLGPVKGFTGLQTAIGPMGRSVEDLDTACRLVFGRSGSPSDAVVPIPYRDIDLPKRLKFGYYLSDGCVKASPASQRAILETITALRNAGHECVEFETTDLVQSLGLFVSLSAADGYATLLSHLGADPQEKSLFLTTLGPKIPGFLRSPITWILKNLIGDEYFANVFSNARKRTVSEYWKSVSNKDEYARLFYEKIWDKYGFDGLIAPGFSTPALPHGSTKTLAPLAVSTILYNVVDSPVGIIPVTRVKPKLDALTDEWFTGPGRGSKLLETGVFGSAAHSAKPAVYDPVAMEGLPVGIQIVGKRWEEEKVLGMMKVVDDALGSRGFGPGVWGEDKGIGNSTAKG